MRCWPPCGSQTCTARNVTGAFPQVPPKCVGGLESQLGAFGKWAYWEDMFFTWLWETELYFPCVSWSPRVNDEVRSLVITYCFVTGPKYQGWQATDWNRQNCEPQLTFLPFKSSQALCYNYGKRTDRASPHLCFIGRPSKQKDWKSNYFNDDWG